MAIKVEATPNPNAMKFTTDSIIFEGNSSVSVMSGQTSEHQILNELMEIEEVDNVFGYQNFITVNKNFDADWDELTTKVQDIISNHGY